MSITLDQVTKRYQGSPVVNDVSLEVGEGEFFVLLGPSGSGKSTLLRAIAGLTGVDHGRISLHGNDVTHVTARQRGVGFVFQNYALVPPHERGREHRVRVAGAPHECGRPAPAAQGVAAPGRARRHGRSSADAALRRPAAACGGRARAGAQARSAAARRALRRARREDSRRAAPHDSPGAARAQDHDRARHARPGRSVRARRSHRRDEPRPLAGERSARRAVRPPATRFVATFLGAANLLLAKQTAQGIRFGATPVNARASRSSTAGASTKSSRCCVPRKIELAPTRDNLRTNYIATGVVDELVFTGALERIRVRLTNGPSRCADRQHVGCRRPRHCAVLDVTRTQHEQRGLPVVIGQSVAIGVRRIHVLPTPLSSYTACAADPRPRSDSRSIRSWSSSRDRMKTRIATRIEPALADPAGQRADAHLRRCSDRRARDVAAADRVAAAQWRRRSAWCCRRSSFRRSAC